MLNSENIISTNDILKLVQRFIKFPAPEICKHLVAADLLSLLDTKGVYVPEELAKSVVGADDETTLTILLEQYGVKDQKP